MKIDELFAWGRKKKVFSSIDVAIWGVENFYLSAQRKIRQLTQEGHFVPLTDEEKISTGVLRPEQVRLAAWRAV